MFYEECKGVVMMVVMERRAEGLLIVDFISQSTIQSGARLYMSHCDSISSGAKLSA